MRKLPKNLDNPIDNILVDVADIISPFLKTLDMTPNAITTVALILALFSINSFVNHEYKTAAIFFFLSYFFDCVDGHFARKYNMVSQFGDYYDHAVDIFKGVVIYSLLFYTLYINDQILVIIILILLLGLLFVHLGCQEKYVEATNNKISSEALSGLKLLCPDQYNCKDKNVMQWTKFFGCGTAVLVTTLVIYNLDYLIKK